jgi:hypothetical protein
MKCYTNPPLPNLPLPLARWNPWLNVTTRWPLNMCCQSSCMSPSPRVITQPTRGVRSGWAKRHQLVGLCFPCITTQSTHGGEPGQVMLHGLGGSPLAARLSPTCSRWSAGLGSMPCITLVLGRTCTLGARLWPKNMPSSLVEPGQSRVGLSGEQMTPRGPYRTGILGRCKGNPYSHYTDITFIEITSWIVLIVVFNNQNTFGGIVMLNMSKTF